MVHKRVSSRRIPGARLEQTDHIVTGSRSALDRQPLRSGRWFCRHPAVSRPLVRPRPLTPGIDSAVWTLRCPGLLIQPVRPPVTGKHPSFKPASPTPTTSSTAIRTGQPSTGSSSEPSGPDQATYHREKDVSPAGRPRCCGQSAGHRRTRVREPSKTRCLAPCIGHRLATPHGPHRYPAIMPLASCARTPSPHTGFLHAERHTGYGSRSSS